MAVNTVHALRGDSEVSSCIMDIIHAFTNGISIFRRLRERKKKHRACRKVQAEDIATSAEFELSKSLRKGQEELTKKYTQCYYSSMGPDFARGDHIAHASLAKTLGKLNTGLVGIIASFLDHNGNCRDKLFLDYKSLTTLSDASRREALHSMNQLYQRLNYSQLQDQQLSSPARACRGNSDDSDCPGTSTASKKDKGRHTSSRPHASGRMVTRMPMKTSSQSQLVVIKLKATKKRCSSSNNSNATRSLPIKACTALPSFPLPKYVAAAPVELPATGVIKGTMGVAPQRRKQKIISPDDPRPSTWPLEYKPHYPTSWRPRFATVTKRHTPTQEKEIAPQPTSDAIAFSLKRRIDKITPSSYTFASDSTQLGEIPQHHWTRQWDYVEAERLNTETVMASHPVQPAFVETAAKKKGFLNFFKRGNASGVATGI